MCYTVEQLEQRAIKVANREAAKIRNIPKKQLDFFAVSGFVHPDLLVISSEEPQYLQPFKWGLIPSWVKDEETAMKLSNMCLNSKSETIFEKPSFKSITKRRCLLPVEGFFEWRTEGKAKYPYFIYMKNKETFYLGCLYDTWVNPATAEIFNTFSIVTTEANPLMAKIHNEKKRMPLIIPDDKVKQWIDIKADKNHLTELMKPFDENQMDAHTISKLITSRSKNPNVPEVTEPFTYPELELLED